jgi:hypothetical protein
MPSIFNSIRGRVFLWFFLFMTILLITLGVFLYQEIKKAIFTSVTHTLHAKVQILKGLLHEEYGVIELEVTEIVSGEYSIPRSGHYYKVIMDGRILAVSPSLVDHSLDLGSAELISYDAQLNEWVYISSGPANEPIMVVRHDFEVFGMPTTIYAAQSLEESLELISRFRNFLLITLPLSILVVALVGFWIARGSLKPLREFSSRIERISHKTLGERVDTRFQAEELKSLASSFNAMLDRLQNAFDIEKRLIADASHELKTPLSVIKTECDVLLERDRAKEEYIRALKTIKNASDSMKRLINDMLSLARIDSGMLSSSEFKLISINNCLEKAVKLSEGLAEERGVKINTTFKKDLKVLGNENTLTEAFLNIIENAIRYNKKGGTVDISVLTNNKEVKVMIKDTGIGIKEDELDKIFNRFYRADASRNTEGTGLGLSIAKAAIEAHDGRIEVESRINEGTCFSITLPLH